jgi:hypothetical protein
VCIHVFSLFKNIAWYGTKITRNTVGERITSFGNFIEHILLPFFIEHILLARCSGVQIRENTLNFTFNSFVDFIHVL